MTGADPGWGAWGTPLLLVIPESTPAHHYASSYQFEASVQQEKVSKKLIKSTHKYNAILF